MPIENSPTPPRKDDRRKIYKKKAICKFCDEHVVSKHFARHLERNHSCEPSVKEFLKLEKKSKERKELLALIRNEGNLEASTRGEIIPKRETTGTNRDENEYAICKFCKAWFKRLYLSRHYKGCFANLDRDDIKQPLMDSIVYATCQKRYGQIINKLFIKETLLKKLRADEIGREVMNDMLIIFYGDDLLKKTPQNRSQYHITARMRCCANFVLHMRKIGPYSNMMSCLKPEALDDIIDATKMIARYDSEKRVFGVPSVALHMGTYLNQIASLTTKIILRKKIQIDVGDTEKFLLALERFQNLVKSQWTTEVGSLALKNATAKAAKKAKLLPLTEDIIKLKNYTDKVSKESFEAWHKKKSAETLRLLIETTLVSLILYNRKRVGDIQYLDLDSFETQINESDVEQKDLLASLSEKEKILTRNYKRIMTIGKGSRQTPILLSNTHKKYLKLIHQVRASKIGGGWFKETNQYIFSAPYSERWMDGCAVLRKYAKACKAKQPQLLTSCRLRKHIATVTQLLNLQKHEIDQLAKFMGHTTKTHEEFYK